MILGLTAVTNSNDVWRMEIPPDDTYYDSAFLEFGILLGILEP